VYMVTERNVEYGMKLWCRLVDYFVDLVVREEWSMNFLDMRTSSWLVSIMPFQNPAYATPIDTASNAKASHLRTYTRTVSLIFFGGPPSLPLRRAAADLAFVDCGPQKMRFRLGGSRPDLRSQSCRVRRRSRPKNGGPLEQERSKHTWLAADQPNNFNARATYGGTT
jgi:hypothetical protein